MAIPMEQWGKDHWTTFAYLETCAVDNKGVVGREQMRCDPDIHPGLANRANSLFRTKYPTRLKGYFKPDGTKDESVVVADHDDWSCFEDMVAAGLMEWNGTGINPVVKFTPEGHKIAGQLREHRASGKPLALFNPSL
jgi:hypothetical protein